LLKWSTTTSDHYVTILCRHNCRTRSCLCREHGMWTYICRTLNVWISCCQKTFCLRSMSLRPAVSFKCKLYGNGAITQKLSVHTFDCHISSLKTVVLYETVTFRSSRVRISNDRGSRDESSERCEGIVHHILIHLWC
jgi:hypothetical protein